MEIIADEGVDRQIVERLRLDGYHVIYIAETAPGANDERILMASKMLGATLVTQDKDFGDLVVRQGYGAHGVVLLRLAGLSQSEKCDIVSSALRTHGHEIEGAFCVMTPRNIRLRRLQEPGVS